MPETIHRCTTYLQARQPGAWRHTLGLVSDLGERLHDQTPRARAQILNQLLWDKAQSLLSTDEITAVVNRHMQGIARSRAIRSYAQSYALLVAAVVVLLGDEALTGDPHDALTLLLSDEPEHQDRARTLIQADRAGVHQAALAALPGFAFLLMARFTNDGLEGFMARDAFWATMLGRQNPCA